MAGLLASACAQTCMTWVQRGNAVPVNPVGTPGQRAHHAMAYDSDRGVTVFFGGEIGTTGNEAYFNDTWEYDGVAWRKINIAGPSPSPRSFHAMAYDSARHQVLLHGGYSHDTAVVDDTWAYTNDGVNGTWRQIAGANQPGFQFGHAMVDDPIRGVVVLQATHRSAAGPSTYEWDGQNWTATAALPIEVHDFSMAYDSHQHLVLLTGGNSGTQGVTIYNSKTYAYRPGEGWFDLGPVSYAPLEAAMAYDQVRGRMVLIGGDNTAQYASELNLEHPELGWYPGTPLPLGFGRSGSAMVYDSRREVMVIMGGIGFGAPNNDTGGRFDDTWELVPNPLAWTIPPPPFTRSSFCRYEPLTLGVLNLDGRPLTYEWFWDGGGLTFGHPAIPGQTGPNLYLPPAPTDVRLDGNGVPIPDPQWGHRVFTVVATDSCGNEFRLEFPVEVHTPPIIKSALIQPDNPGQYDVASNYVRCPGDAITLTLPLGGVILDLGSPALPATYQWLLNGQPVNTNYNPVLGGPRIIPDQNHLSILNLAPSDTGEYSVEISNGCGGATRSASFHLQVGVSILKQPDSMVGQVCNSGEFSVNAIGYGMLHYQWRLDGAPLPGDDSHFTGPQTPHLQISPLLYAHEGNYDVIVSDECGPMNSVTSKVAVLTIKPGPQWALRATSGPSARSAPALAYDSRRHLTVLFGGESASAVDPNVTVSLNDLWEWDGARWAQRMTNNPAAAWLRDNNGYWRPNYAAGQPPPRQRFGMVYDNRRGRVVLFGGESFDPDGGQNFLNDLWEWDGSVWYFRGTNGPAKRMLHSMAYNAARGTTVLYGGFTIPDNGTVWEWDGHVWATRTPDSGPVKNYYQDIGAMAYDSFRHYTFFGPAVDGFFSTHFFAWDGSVWTDQGPGYSPVLGPFWDGGMAYDGYRRRTVWFGGRNSGGVTPNVTPTWDGAHWSFLADPPGAPPPPARFFDALAYDSFRHAVVMFGGEGTSLGQPPHNFAAPQTWELIALDTPLINDQPASQYRPPGDTAVFGLTAVGPPGAVLHYRWYHGNQLLTDDGMGHLSGSATPTLTIVGVTVADAGSYHAVVSDDCGETSSLAAILTLEPRLQIFTAADTTSLIWSDPTVILEQADAVSGPWSDVPGATSPFVPSIVGPAKFFRVRPGP